MSATHILIEMIGNVVLLLWGLHMVQTGLTRAFGADLRHLLAIGLRNRWTAVLAGLGVTALLQSSTATGLMVTGFAAAGLMPLVPAMAAMLGANIGTTLIVQILSFDVAWIAPVLLVAGFLGFRRGGRTRTRDLGRVLIGLGLMLLSLHLLLATVGPAAADPALRNLLGLLTGDPVVALLLSAVLTWAAHSSAAMVLLVASLAGGQVIGLEAAVAMVAGANLGSAINPVLEGPGGGGDPAARRLPLGNLLNRLVGCLLLLPLLEPVTALLTQLPGGRGWLVANAHLAFNLATGLLFIGPLPWLAALLERLLPENDRTDEPGAPRYLDPAALRVPHLAIANAAREALRMADTVEAMLHGTLEVFRTDDRRVVERVRAMDDVLDRLLGAIKLYLTQISQEDLEERDARRSYDVLALTINLEHIGDIVDRNLMAQATKKIRRRLKFSDEGAAEIAAMLERLIETGRLATAVFVSGDPRAARDLMREKEVVRAMESDAIEAHVSRLRAGRSETLETSALHLDILRDLRRINAHLAAAAYPVLDPLGELRSSRLREAKSGPPPVESRPEAGPSPGGAL